MTPSGGAGLCRCPRWLGGGSVAVLVSLPLARCHQSAHSPGAQALISTALASSCSRITCTPAVRSSRGAPRDRAGEPGGERCVRVEAGERAGERW